MSTIVPQTAEPLPPGSMRAVDDEAERLRARIEALGLEARVHRLGAQLTTGGLTARVSLGNWRSPGSALDQDVERQLASVAAALQRGVAVNVAITDLGGGDAAAEHLEAFCERLGGLLDAPRRGLGLCVSAAEIRLADFRRIARRAFGDGPRYILPSRRQCDIDRPDADIDAAWAALHAAQSGPSPLWPACFVGVRSRCPLLGGEKARVVVPDAGITAPSGSAWLPIELDVCRFAAPNGGVCQGALDQALDGCIALGDRLLDRITWPDERQRDDARMNRRLAILLRGLGDLVVLRGQDPTDLGCLRSIDRLVGRIYESLWRRSRRLAEVRGPLPALAEKQPSGEWHDEAHRRDWQRRWRRALDEAQVRHRNLLVMSPYSVLPRTVCAKPAFADLLPVLAHADALSFADPPPMQCWKTSDFRHFHQRTLALAARLNAASFIAVGV